MPIQSPLHKVYAPQPGELILDGSVIVDGAGAVVAASSDRFHAPAMAAESAAA